MPANADAVKEVVVHPIVLLSAVDHFHRVLKDNKKRDKRVVGVLLGSYGKGTVDVTNSFAVPFEEDAKNPSIFFLDHNYLETMFRMYKKVNARERIMGFYSSGPKIKESDIKVRRTPSPAAAASALLSTNHASHPACLPACLPA